MASAAMAAHSAAHLAGVAATGGAAKAVVAARMQMAATLRTKTKTAGRPARPRQ